MMGPEEDQSRNMCHRSNKCNLGDGMLHYQGRYNSCLDIKLMQLFFINTIFARTYKY
jgi:hypothetical protein